MLPHYLNPLVMSNVQRALEQAQTATLVKFTDHHACRTIPSDNAFSSDEQYIYVNKKPLLDMEPGAVFELPPGKLVTKADSEGNVRTTKTGIPLMFYVA